MKTIYLLITLLLFVICNCSNNATITSDAMIRKNIVSEEFEEADNNLLSSEKNSNLQDSILGCWGTHPETGNSILCFISSDSVFWVDPSIWCKYSITNDTIIMETDSFIYFQGKIKIQDDYLFLSDSDFIWKYKRNEN